ncbi:unnamed protein product [Dicrocoelium dendriticum]|nr:unnamed protein product [Dicrocoelium dendriticum]
MSSVASGTEVTYCYCVYQTASSLHLLNVLVRLQTNWFYVRSISLNYINTVALTRNGSHVLVLFLELQGRCDDHNSFQIYVKADCTFFFISAHALHAILIFCLLESVRLDHVHVLCTENWDTTYICSPHGLIQPDQHTNP